MIDLYVCKYVCQVLGPLTFRQRDDPVFYGQRISYVLKAIIGIDMNEIWLGISVLSERVSRAATLNRRTKHSTKNALKTEIC